MRKKKSSDCVRCDDELVESSLVKYADVGAYMPFGDPTDFELGRYSILSDSICGESRTTLFRMESWRFCDCSVCSGVRVCVGVGVGVCMLGMNGTHSGGGVGLCVIVGRCVLFNILMRTAKHILPRSSGVSKVVPSSMAEKPC